MLAMLLKAVLVDLRAVELLSTAGYSTAAATVASSLYEKSVIGRYIMLSPQDRAAVYMRHTTKRSLPWRVRDMIEQLVRGIDLEAAPAVEAEAEYLQYILLCSLKHPQASTILFAAEAHGGPDTLTRSFPARPCSCVRHHACRGIACRLGFPGGPGAFRHVLLYVRPSRHCSRGA